MQNTHLREASRILFWDPEWALQDWMKSQLDDANFRHPEDDRLMSVNQLAAELEAAANG